MRVSKENNNRKSFSKVYVKQNIFGVKSNARFLLGFHISMRGQYVFLILQNQILFKMIRIGKFLWIIFLKISQKKFQSNATNFVMLTWIENPQPKHNNFGNIASNGDTNYLNIGVVHSCSAISTQNYKYPAFNPSDGVIFI